MSTADVLGEVYHERHLQDSKWGIQNHLQVEWLAILAEEFGEVSKEVNEFHFRHHREKELRAELLQTAAVCVAMIESLDRNGK